MKAPFLVLLAAGLAFTVRGQSQTEYTPEQLDQLLAPIALYPDPLIALILPAATDPADLSLAAQFVSSGADPSGIDAQPWDASIKGLAHYPAVVTWMNDNADWTHSLGAAFAMQPSDVMKSVQQLRAQARAAGTLVNTPQQQVDVEGDDVRIVPAQADMMYVPEYDPDAVYEDQGDAAGSYVTFSVGYPVGPWLGYQLDWDDFGIWVGPWHPGWAYRREWRDGRGDGGARWHVDPRRGHDLVRNYYRPGALPRRPSFAQAPRGVVRAPAPGRGPAPAIRPQPRPTLTRQDYRGYSSGTPRPSSPAPSSPVFGGYTRGTQARDFSSRGQTSRQAPVRGAVHSQPSRGAPEPDRRKPH